MKINICVLTILLVLSGLPVHAATVYVDRGATGSNNGSSWSNAYTTVQAGLNDASSSDEIWVAAGTYDETVTFGDGDKLYGGFSGGETSRAQRDWTNNPSIIGPSGGGTPVTLDSNCTIDGIYVTGADTAAGIYILGGFTTPAPNITVDNCRAYSNSAHGIYLGYTTTATVRTNICYANSGNGIYVFGGQSFSVSNTVSGNTCHDNGGYGIRASEIEETVIFGNECYVNTNAGITTRDGARYSTISSNTCYSNNMSGTPQNWAGGITVFGNDNIVSNNTTYGNGFIEISLVGAAASNNIVTRNECFNGGYGIWIQAPNNTVSSNVCYLNGSGILLHTLLGAYSRGNLICDNELYGDGSGKGIYFLDGDSNTVSNNIVHDLEHGIYVRGYSLSAGSCNNVLAANNVYSNTYGLYVDASSGGNTNNLCQDELYTNSATTDIYIQDSEYHHFVLWNTQYSSIIWNASGGTSKVERWWYLDVKCEDSHGLALSDATVAVASGDGGSVANLPATTGTNGHTSLASAGLVIKDYDETQTTTNFYTYTISASKPRFNNAKPKTGVDPDTVWYRTDPDSYPGSETNGSYVMTLRRPGTILFLTSLVEERGQALTADTSLFSFD